MLIDFSKTNGLVPVIIQNYQNLQVLMLGYMNEEAFAKTQSEGKVTFFSRSKNRLWTKGETSGNFLIVKDILVDCDNDTLLIKADPLGPTCHTGSTTCFKEETAKGFLYELQQTKKLEKRLLNWLLKPKTTMKCFSKTKLPTCFITSLYYLKQKM